MKRANAILLEYEALLVQALQGCGDTLEEQAALLGEAAAVEMTPAAVTAALQTKTVQSALGTGNLGLVVERAGAYQAAFLRGYDRALAEMRSAYSDMSEQKRALEHLPEILLEGIPAVIYVAPWRSEPGEVLYVSPQSEAVLGYSALDWLNQPNLWISRLDPEDAERTIIERMEGVLRVKGYTSEYRFQHSNGEWLWLHDEVRLVCNAAGEPEFWQGVLLDITQRKAAEREAAVGERARLARELHDSVMQTLIASEMHISRLRKNWHTNHSAAASQIETITKLTHIAIAELRLLLLEMHPTELTRTSLAQLLTLLAGALGSHCTTAVVVTVEPVPPLPADVQVGVYRIAQEALNNIARHAKAASAQVRLQGSADHVGLVISDDGAGFDPLNIPGGHLGVRGMFERAGACGAELTVHSCAGSGTKIELRWDKRRQ